MIDHRKPRLHDALSWWDFVLVGDTFMHPTQVALRWPFSTFLPMPMQKMVVVVRRNMLYGYVPLWTWILNISVIETAKIKCRGIYILKFVWFGGVCSLHKHAGDGIGCDTKYVWLECRISLWCTQFGGRKHRKMLESGHNRELEWLSGPSHSIKNTQIPKW